ncbi:MAG: leucine-rich repeat domain-containing protein [Oscillospiraceae bacterium]|nr:leucine-rich repeat domain-containing protein [Oscillospiraceae bacterium]
MGLFDWFKESKRKKQNVEVEKTAPKHSSFCADYIKREEMYIPDRPKEVKAKVKYITLTLEQAITQGWHFKRKSRKRIRITHYTGTNKNVIIPSEIGGYIVNEISGGAFFRADIERVEIPDTVKKLHCSCFGQSKVKAIIIAEGITEIPNGFAFSCQELVSVHLPTTLFRIGNCAFENCTNLKYIDIPKSCGYIDNRAFSRSGIEGFAYQDGIYKEVNGTVFQRTPLDNHYKLILRTEPSKDEEYRILSVGRHSLLQGTSDIKLPGGKVWLGACSVMCEYRHMGTLDFSECTKVSAHIKAFELSDRWYDGKLSSGCVMEVIVPQETKCEYFPDCIDVKYPNKKKYDGFISVESRDNDKTVLRIHGNILPAYSVVFHEKSLEIRTDRWTKYEKYAICSKELESISFDNLLNGTDELFAPCCHNLHRVEMSNRCVFIPSSDIISERLHTELMKAFTERNLNGKLCWFDSSVVDNIFSGNSIKSRISQKRKIIIACDVLRSTAGVFENSSMYEKYLQTHRRYALILCVTLPDEYTDFLRNFYEVI